MKVKINKSVEVEPALIRIHAKCGDMCSMKITDTNNNILVENDGYVPSFFPGDHYGDYIILDIDPKTGIIINWPKAEYVEKGIQAYINEKDRD